jgi:hypothetical protein
VPLLRSDIVGQPNLALTVGGRRQALTQGEQAAIRASLQNVSRVNIQNRPLVLPRLRHS